MASLAWRTGKDHEIILRFAEQAKSYMRKDGSVILILSSDMRTDEVVSMFSSRGYAVYPRMSRRKLFETFTIYEFKSDLV